MSLKVNKRIAEQVLRAEAELAQVPDGVASPWAEMITAFSDACEGTSKTHIAFLGTALLAKSVEPRVDAFAVKAGAGTPGAYSARGLSHGVLVPLAPVLGIDLGVSGREPLNNQPYFRILRATEDEILPLVKDPAPARMLVRLLEALDRIRTADEARAALRAYIQVRRRYQRSYPTLEGPAGSLSLRGLITAVQELVTTESEGGRRAQACAAGLFDAVFGRDRVEAGRINDPDRHLPGDVGVVSAGRAGVWDRALEVRDKPVTTADLILFAKKLASEGVRMAGVIAVSEAQRRLDPEEAVLWARGVGVELNVFFGWERLISEAVFWAPAGPEPTIRTATSSIRTRLIEVEASSAAVDQWDRLTVQ